MTSSNFGQTILGEAVRSAVGSVAQQLESRAGALPTRTVTIDGLVADAAPDGTLIINIGSSSGVKVGDKLVVKRVGSKIADPATGKTLRSMEDAIGEVTITEVDASSAVGKFSGSGTPKVGDAIHGR